LTFKELRVYKLAFELQQEVFKISRGFPAQERYSLVDQIRRSSRSIGANIAEAWQKRRYIAHFVSKLSDADGEQAETQHWIDTATACDYVSQEERKSMLDKCSGIGQMLSKMMANADDWCHKSGTPSDRSSRHLLSSFNIED